MHTWKDLMECGSRICQETPLAINGFIALYANFDEEYLCLIPKSPFYLEGAGGELGNKLGQDQLGVDHL
nr:hypothetical protein CFP56_69264 [Quercus suber]